MSNLKILKTQLISNLKYSTQSGKKSNHKPKHLMLIKKVNSFNNKNREYEKPKKYCRGQVY